MSDNFIPSENTFNWSSQSRDWFCIKKKDDCNFLSMNKRMPIYEWIYPHIHLYIYIYIFLYLRISYIFLYIYVRQESEIMRHLYIHIYSYMHSYKCVYIYHTKSAPYLNKKEAANISTIQYWDYYSIHTQTLTENLLYTLLR